MVYLIQLRKLVFLLPPAIIIVCIALSKTTLFADNPSRLSLAITFDLLITTPLIYFLIIRKRAIPETTLVPVFILGVVVASAILPTEHQYYLSIVKTWFLPFVEIGILTYLIITIRKVFRKIKQDHTSTPDFFAAAKNAGESILPKAVSTVFATELSLFYYGFINWRKQKLRDRDFSYHKTSSTQMLLGVFIFLIIVEAFAVHLLLQGYSQLAAWILTGLSIYACFQVFGILRSISKRPISIEKDRIVLRYGVMSETQISLKQIQKVTLHTTSIGKRMAWFIYLHSKIWKVTMSLLN